ncbi:glycosyltransferase family 2 protein [Streptomyces sp. NEAU-W12]|uniref:glycosyltransferase family 2 protein n=1 Tax=Streptomyces sp. NEAU-W12 TaxID=2994668 RepID=UPI00224A4B36|nr:glycosyltransferase family 2 protein [Streptomyces sp. NEAU-W12]MCX2924953.1 glycosyltransferase family 2 protein [Streptomyces sp. NEAU-W12]MCX2927794.1 glycosyltransferase family 2 protein [Streptomyces sp. NEAU-W12]
MPVKVSVIVPVYNPGAYIEDCISSLRRQSLPPEEYEAVFVDDGSTDGTPARLDRLAAEDPRMRVIHQENSGWSGTPRNVGIAAARGEFVMFVDNDDYLGDEALERMYTYGVANGADVVVGKMAGRNRGVPVELFRRNHPRATVENAPLIDSLTPHKMFRRAFLDEIGLRFPEGRRRLEDHVFVTEAYLRAANVSVLSDYVCYYHIRRDDASNAGFQRFDPVGYFTNLREALDVVERYTGPGPVRDRLFRRWLRVEMVERLRARRLLGLPDDYRRELFGEIHKVVVERFGPAVAAGLQPTQQVVASLTAADRYDDVVAFAEWEAGVAATASPTGVEWEGGSLRLGFTAEYASAGAPMTFPADAVRAPLADTPKSVEEAVAWVGAQTAARFTEATADLLLRERSSSAQYFQPVELVREKVPVDGGERVRLVLRATASVDPGVLPGDGAWDAVVRVRLGGWTKECRLGPAPRATRPEPYAGVVAGRAVLPYWTEPHGNLSLDVAVKGRRLGLGQVRRPDVTVSGARLRARIPLHAADGTPVRLRFSSAGRTLYAPGSLTAEPQRPGSRLEATLPSGLPRGVWRVALDLDREATEPRFSGLPFAVRVGRGGVLVVQVPRPRTGRKLLRRARRVLGAARARVAPLVKGRR